MSGLFRGCMRHGAKVLLVFAIIQVLVGLYPLLNLVLTETSHMARNLGYSPGMTDLPFSMQLQLMFSTMSGAVLPFFGALVIDRLDRWLSVRDRESAE